MNLTTTNFKESLRFGKTEYNFFSLKMRSGNLTAQYSVSKSESPFDAADQGYYYRTTQTNTFKNTNDIKESQALWEVAMATRELGERSRILRDIDTVNASEKRKKYFFAEHTSDGDGEIHES